LHGLHIETTIATLMKTTLTHPCAHCPFLTNSPPAWLGPWSPQDLLLYIRYQPFACHLTINQPDMAVDDARLQHCAGAALFLNRTLTLGRHPATLAHQKALRTIDQDPAPSVFDSPEAFLAHHSREGLETFLRTRAPRTSTPTP